MPITKTDKVYSGKCDRCGRVLTNDPNVYTVLLYQGEALRDAVSEDEATMCMACRVEFQKWLHHMEGK